eukprot:CAMPEP_0183299496 /NCGR_PEP_ID=MMETSP0160_2-20130417/6216_1 /TAXON_ID=2839 ORGANISM="Odontella Sinensis, Strain Grunow 1884" /NCGR_SAMPLE_ID=MMETSP0160_2 /ASSEMBLY_ACC=CAM_ASM_000250 /LENGTH=399 /DNA_ID=CAMNT_0025461751 /DNA_START=23 /DNA_END=1222 /DNA_ORIENTATION=+
MAIGDDHLEDAVALRDEEDRLEEKTSTRWKGEKKRWSDTSSEGDVDDVFDDNDFNDASVTPMSLGPPRLKGLEGGGYGPITPKDASKEIGPATAETLPIPSLWYRILPRKITSSMAFERVYRIVTSNVASDDPPHLGGLKIMDGREAVRFFKFAAVTLVAIAMFHPLVRRMGWEYDDDYELTDFLLYDLNYVLLDILSFYLVGRLYKRRGMDCLFPFLVPMACGVIYPSWTTTLSFLHHSFSLYEIHCTWPWLLFAWAGGIILLAAVVVTAHVWRACKDGDLIWRLAEAILSVLVFIAPYASHPNFHLHHWYASWLIGMHFNADTWWSKMALAFMWGQYINGIAVWGRDPLLTCAYGYYISTDIRCSYMKCYHEEGKSEYKPFIAPDWRNCSASTNYVP